MFLFLGRIYNLNEYDTNFLNNMSFLIASITESYGINRKLQLSEEKVKNQRERLLSSSKTAIYDQQGLRHVHTYKNEILRIVSDLQQLEECTGRKHNELLSHMIEKTKKKIDVVEQEFPGQTQTYNKCNYSAYFQMTPQLEKEFWQFTTK